MRTFEIKTVVVLCGAHSGSSMLAGCLHRMGVEMEDGESHLETGGIHPKGMWERKQFEIMNDKILDKAGGSWHHPPEEERILQLVNDETLGSLVRGLVRQTQKPLWGWKDPRNALTIPVWHPHLVNPYYIAIFRNENAMADSYMCDKYRWKFGKDFKIREEAITHIQDYHKRIWGFIDDKQDISHAMAYEAILEYTPSELEWLGAFLNVKVNKEALEMVDPSLRHF